MIWVYPIFEEKAILIASMILALVVALIFGKLGKVLAMIIVALSSQNIYNFLVYFAKWVSVWAHNDWGFGRELAMLLAWLPQILMFIMFLAWMLIVPYVLGSFSISLEEEKEEELIANHNESNTSSKVRAGERYQSILDEHGVTQEEMMRNSH